MAQEVPTLVHHVLAEKSQTMQFPQGFYQLKPLYPLLPGFTLPFLMAQDMQGCSLHFTDVLPAALGDRYYWG